MKIKRLYEKPSMKVYELRKKPVLLVNSGGGGFGEDPGYVPLP